MASYERSTQKAHWTFPSQEDVDRVRADVRSAQVKAAEARGIDPKTMLTEEETKAIEAIYLNKIRAWCLDPKEARKLNERLVDVADDGKGGSESARSSQYADVLFWTASSFFKRFFLRNSMLQFNPFVMRAVAVYVAGKAEEIPLTSDLRGVRVDKLGALANTAPEMIVENEIAFLGGIDFELAIFSPQRPLEGLMEALRAKDPKRAKMWRSLETSARNLLQNVLYTDLLFLQPPSRLAFAALVTAHGEVKKNAPDFSREELLAWILPEGIDPPATLLEELTALGNQLKEAKGAVKAMGGLLRASANAEGWVKEWTKHCAKLPAANTKPIKRKRKRETGDGAEDEKEDADDDAKMDTSGKRIKVEDGGSRGEEQEIASAEKKERKKKKKKKKKDSEKK
ncbi:Cyclin-H [Hondaea fermentalgiana]|uniref:Cyclin-H n=1 Tax=Hondaea fermentalgiana TaxID=2315210 RepID=A0A2R5G5J4_9STRA|nr:Cyclin-H [Hondaea fermentalgiana]|eukprot:GBG26322.1 Cyclin-H [Hondaea fermentalgiana]